MGLIFPWNGPVFNFCAKLAPSLAAGCSSVVKPAEETPLSALVLDRILAEAGVPEGVVNLVNGYGHTAGAAITAHPDVEKVAFTGSTEVGRAIVHAAADSNLNKVTLELGGKSPVLIFDDANLDLAIPMASFGTFIHSGQACVCGSRIFAQRGVYERVVEGIANMANVMQLGGPKDDGAMVGPLISQKQLSRVLGYLDQGKADGVELVAGGHRLDRKGYFVHPTVVTNVDPDTSRLFQEEIFGPVVTILPFDDEDEAVALANNSSYGLAPHVDQRPRPGAPNCQAAQSRNGGAELSDAIRSLDALRGIQAIRLGIRVRQGRHRDLPANENRLGPDVGVSRRSNLSAC